MNRIEEELEEERELPDMDAFFVFVAIMFGLGVAAGIGQYFYGGK